MAKSKTTKPTSVSRKKWSRKRVFILGVLVGIAPFWLPIDRDFSPAHFSQNEWTKQPIDSIFSKYLPTTTPLIQREGFIVSYNGQTRNPHWVYHRLTSEILGKKISRENFEFKEDPLIPMHIRATKNDYQSSGFDRGHLCAAADCISKEALENSFFLSNIVPQTPALNRGYWKKLENHVRDLTKQYKVVHVFSGPLYLSTKSRYGKRFVSYQVIGKNQVAVPTHFFMLIFVEIPSSKMMTKAYVLPNILIDPNTPLKKFSSSVENIESASGVMFTKILE